jgi:hypothetical protein
MSFWKHESKLMDKLEQLENLAPVKWAMIHPRLAAWIVLSVGMVALLVNEARDVGLTTGNWISLVVATVLVAGVCIMIVSWEDDDESEEEADTGELAEAVSEQAETPEE